MPPETLPQALRENYKKYGSRVVAMRVKDRGIWQEYTWEDYYLKVKYFCLGLVSLGLNRGDKVSILGENKPEWFWAELAVQSAGGAAVGIFTDCLPNEVKYYAEHSDSTFAVVHDQEQVDKFLEIKNDVPKLKKVIYWDPKGLWTYTDPILLSFDEVIALGKDYEQNNPQLFDEMVDQGRSDDIGVFCYTSGTTGFPKGVMLSHRNIISNVLTSSKLQPLGSKHKVLSFLPLCHIFERTSNYQFQYSGTGIYYAESLRTIPENLNETKADGFTTVPRLLEKVYLAILNRRSHSKGIKKYILDWSLQIAGEYPLNHKLKASYKLKRKVAGILVFRKIRKAFGGKVRFIGCGGASLQTNVEKVLWAAGIPVFQGYGLTETSPLITLNHYPLDKSRIGTVGTVINGVQVKIAGDGEILCKGPNVMLGYYKNPELTKKVLDKNGWFHTGDIGKLQNGNFLKISGRKKELFKTSYGKYVAPQVIENRLKESGLIDQVIVIGEGEKFAGAIISPNFDMLSKWLETIHKIKIPDRKKLIQLPVIINRFQEEINKSNQSLGMPEQIKQFILVSEEWNVRTGELSPTLKLRRHFILKKYKELIENIYNPVKKNRD